MDCLSGQQFTFYFQVDPVVPFSFPTQESYLKIPSVIANRLRISFNFRTYNKGSLLFAHDLNPAGRVMVRLNNCVFKRYRFDFKEFFMHTCQVTDSEFVAEDFDI